MIEIRTPESLVPVEMLAALGPRQIDQFTRNMAAAARDKWIMLAQADNDYGSHMKEDYIHGIQEPVVSRGTAVISLVGTVANLLEHGDNGVDLRDLLLGDRVPVVPRGRKGGKHEAVAGGYYRAIPFRHRTPGTTGGQQMGSAYSGQMGEGAAKKLGAEVYGRAMKLKAYGTQGVKPEDVRLPAGMVGLLRDHHKTDIYAGMIRERKTYEKATQTQYFTFRTISDHTTDDRGRRVGASVGWRRGPIPARNFAQRVADYVAKIAADAARTMLEAR